MVASDRAPNGDQPIDSSSQASFRRPRNLGSDGCEQRRTDRSSAFQRESSASSFGIGPSRGTRPTNVGRVLLGWTELEPNEPRIRCSRWNDQAKIARSAQAIGKGMRNAHRRIEPIA